MHSISVTLPHILTENPYTHIVSLLRRQKKNPLPHTPGAPGRGLSALI